MAEDLAIVGAGGFGKEMLSLVNNINSVDYKWNLKGFFDDSSELGDSFQEMPISGTVNDLSVIKNKLSVTCAIGDSLTRKSIFERLIMNKNLSFPSLIHPNSIFQEVKKISIGYGSTICANSILTIDISIGKCSLINLNCTVGHDVEFGDFVSLMPGCNISGDVKIGSNSFLGSGVNVINGIKIGENCKIGSGSVVTKHIPDNKVAVGVPARIINQNA